MVSEAHVDISVDSNEYERLINTVKSKAPVEIGIEVVVYMLLYGVMENSRYEVIDVNSMRKIQASIYSKLPNKDKIDIVPDLAIVDKEFNYNDEKSQEYACGFVEIKYLNVSNNIESEAVKTHKRSTNKLIWTNGLDWYYYDMMNDEKSWNVSIQSMGHLESKEHIYIDRLHFQELLVRLEEIEWGN